MKVENQLVQGLVGQILSTKKYRHLGLNQATVEDLVRQETLQQGSQKATLKAVRRKLHNIVAPYLGQPDYPALTKELFKIEDLALDSPQLKNFCLKVLSQHASTAERIPIMDEFYPQLFHAPGKPQVIFDLACGLHPLAFPWMGLPASVCYHAFDIIQPRVDFINLFLSKIGLTPLAENRDILVNPPEGAADLAFFFKEAHRFEKRQPGCNRAFWSALNVKTLAVSLPATDLSGTHSLQQRHRDLVFSNLPEGLPIQEIKIENEIVFLIDKSLGAHNG